MHIENFRLIGSGVSSRQASSLFGGTVTVALTALLAVVLVALPLTSARVSDVPVLLFVVPIALCAVRFGLRGGLAAAGVGASIALLWFVHGQHFSGGLVDFASQATVFVLVGGLVGAVVDGRKELERTIANHNEFSLDLVCTASLDGYFTWVNPAWTRVLGYQPQELCERPFADFIHPDDQEATAVELRRQTVAGLSVMNFQNRYRAADGSYRWLEWMSRPDGKSKQLIAVARDVTERKQAEDAIANYRDELEHAVRGRTAELEQRTHELEDSRRETLRRLALAAEYRDDNTFEHTERVGQIAALLAERLRLPAEQVALIRLAAPLHDVGKLKLSDRILLKPGKLTPAEFEQMTQHTVDGACILSDSSSDVLQLGEQIALSHHEWWNGNGYPHNLQGDEIPLAAQIVGIADVFDALTHTRPYKPAWTVEQAVDHIRGLRGCQFAPSLVDAFEELDHQALADSATADASHLQQTVALVA